MREIRKFEVFETGGEELAIEAARNFRSLRQRGDTVRKTIGCLIATFWLRHGHSLLHRDRDYDHFEAILGLAAGFVLPPSMIKLDELPILTSKPGVCGEEEE